MSGTIAALATAQGGAINIIRVSGPAALDLALKISRRSSLTPRYAHFARLYAGANLGQEEGGGAGRAGSAGGSGGDLIDEGLVLYFAGPASFTGEDVVEFQLHGGAGVAARLLGELLGLGARLARPGEFSKRACLNSKMSPLQALNISELIRAKSARAATRLAQNMQGQLGELIEKMREELVRTLAFAESAIDYAEDDLPDDLQERTLKMCEENARILGEIYERSISRRGLVEGFSLAIIGRANVGKSSLLNALLGQDRAITSPRAGTTRDTVEEELLFEGFLLRLIDTAGIRQGEDEIEREGIIRSREKISQAELLIVLFDGAAPAGAWDEELLALLPGNKKIFYVLNKSDLPLRFFESEAGERIKKVAGDLIRISARRGELAPLKKALAAQLAELDNESHLSVSAELTEAMRLAWAALGRAGGLLREGGPSGGELELFAFELNEALFQLAKFSRHFDREEILDELFANFCLGK